MNDLKLNIVMKSKGLVLLPVLIRHEPSGPDCPSCKKVGIEEPLPELVANII